jgi:hypothetical protein
MLIQTRGPGSQWSTPTDPVVTHSGGNGGPPISVIRRFNVNVKCVFLLKNSPALSRTAVDIFGTPVTNIEVKFWANAM